MQVLAKIQLNFQQPNYLTVYAAQNDRLSRYINAQLLDGSTPWTLPTGGLMTIRYRKPDGTSGFYDTLEDGSPAYNVETDGSITFGLAEQALTVPGMVPVELNFYNAAGAKLSTLSFIVAVKPSAYSDEDIASSDYYNVLTAKMQQLAELSDQAEGDYQEYLSALSAFVGAPRTAPTAADMLDTNLVYVYTGNETGYTYGDWYYYNGREWVSGGVYNSAAISLDATLTNADKPAQAKAAGDLVLVQDTQPTDQVNKLWFPLTDPEEVQVPTMEEFVDLKSSVNELEAGSLSALNADAGQVPVALGDGTWEWAAQNNGATITQVQLQRMFRFVNKAGGTIPVNQCVVNTGSTLLFGGTSPDNLSQRIVETDFSGDSLENRDATFSTLGHFNDMTYYDGQIVTVDSSDGYLHFIDYATLTETRTVEIDKPDQYDSVIIYGISYLDGEPVGLISLNSDNTQTYLCNLNLTDGTWTIRATIVQPIVYNGLYPVRQTLTIYDGAAYLVYNYNNHVLKVNPDSGAIEAIYDLDTGDGYFPVGEVESAVFIGEQMHVLSNLHYNSGVRTTIIDQFFKTDVGGMAVQSTRYGQGEEMIARIYVDGTSTEKNPDGAQTNPLSSLEEACMVYTYRINKTDVDNTGIEVSNATGLAGEAVYLENCHAELSLAAVQLSNVQLRNVTGGIVGLYSDNAVFRNCDLYITNANITKLTQAYLSRIIYSGRIGTVTQLQRSTIEFLGNAVADPVTTYTLEGITLSKIIGGTRGLNYSGKRLSYVNSAGSATISLDGAAQARLTTLFSTASPTTISGLSIRLFVALANSVSAADPANMVETRFTLNNMNQVQQGNSASRKTVLVTLDANDNPLAIRLTLTLSKTALTVAVDKVVRVDTGVVLTDLELVIADVNFFSLARDLM